MLVAWRAVRLTVLAAFSWALGVHAAFAQDQGSRALGTTMLTLAEGIDRVGSGKSATTQQLEKVQTQLFNLEQELNRRQSAVPESYLVTFKSYQDGLRQALSRPDSPAAVQLLAAISEDLVIKNRLLSESAGISGTRAPPVFTVRVHTVRGAIPAPGYRVSFNSLSNLRIDNPTHPVASDTNNAVRDLPPGAYALQFWSGGKLVDSRPVDIPTGSSDPITIDVTSFAN